MNDFHKWILVGGMCAACLFLGSNLAERRVGVCHQDKTIFSQQPEQ